MAERTDTPEDCCLEQWSKLAQEQGTRVLNDLRVGVGKAIEALGRGFLSHPRNDQLVEKLRTGSLSKDDFYRQLLRTVYRLLFLFVAEDRELLHPASSDEKACALYDTHYSTRRLRELANEIRGSKRSDLWHSLSLVFDALGKTEGCPELGLIGGLGSLLWRSDSTADLLGPLHQSAPSEGENDNNVPALALGEGWSEGEPPTDVTSATDPVLITNEDLLSAIRELAFVEQDRVLRAVDYRNLGGEELGRVYESLLELHPVMNADLRTFELSTATGNERKTTGSYYTPDSLVQCLLDSALDPVVEDRLTGKEGREAEAAILGMTVCDPACGSGHFLIAAAHRLARHLARIRTGETAPNPEAYQRALRDVIGRCIYGVDINPMAVELCKVSLWMEAIDPGRPLTFLDHHIQCGNSLLGTTPALLASGIPDGAFTPIEGDDKSVCTELKRENKRQRQERAAGQGMLFDPPCKLDNFPSSFVLSSGEDDSVESVAEKERRYTSLVSGADYQNDRLLADTWCAVFVWKKDESDLGRLCPTEDDFRKIENDPHSILPQVKSEVRRLAIEYRFFHWHLAFPDIFRRPGEGENADNVQAGWNSGFDVVLGNPPWDKVELLEKEWFAEKSPEIATTKTAAIRKKMIGLLAEKDAQLFCRYREATRKINATRHFLRASKRYPFCSDGRVNLYAMFAEGSEAIQRSDGRVGFIVPTGIATDDTTKRFFRNLLENRRLISLFDFDNRKGIFAGVQGNVKFCLLTLGRLTGNNAVVGAQLDRVDDVRDESRIYDLSLADISRINPNTFNCPTFKSAKDAVLNKMLYRRHNVLLREATNSNDWRIRLRQGLFNMTSDSDLFCTAEELIAQGCALVGNIFRDASARVYRPLFEAKHIYQFDHRAATFESVAPQDRFKTHARTNAPSTAELRDPNYVIQPRYWVDDAEVKKEAAGAKWFLVFRDIISAVADRRSFIAACIPYGGVGNTLPIVETRFGAKGALCLLSMFNSFICDYLLRQKASGSHLNFYVFKQLPAIAPEKFKERAPWDHSVSIEDWVVERALELTFTSWDLQHLARECGYTGDPFVWDPERRDALRCELDAAFFHLYLGNESSWRRDAEVRKVFPTPRDAADYVMEAFPIVKSQDIARTEETNEAGKVVTAGRYTTKLRILESYDALANASRRG